MCCLSSRTSKVEIKIDTKSLKHTEFMDENMNFSLNQVTTVELPDAGEEKYPELIEIGKVYCWHVRFPPSLFCFSS